MSATMTKTEKDISDTIVAKSDQINADDLVAGPVVVTITGAKRSSADDQPVELAITDFKPFRPCKTMRRVLVSAWGKDATQWVGKSMRLYRDSDVKWAGERVGGIRIAALSHITKKLELALSESRGAKKKLFTIDVLAGGTSPASQSTQPQSGNLADSFLSMKTKWKGRREDRGLSVDADQFRIFVESATGGLVPAVNALNMSSYTPELIEKCIEHIRSTMPEPLT